MSVFVCVCVRSDLFDSFRMGGLTSRFEILMEIKEIIRHQNTLKFVPQKRH